MTRATDSRINEYLYLIGRHWRALEFEEQCHVRQGTRQGILQNVNGTIRLTEWAEGMRPGHGIP